MSLHISTKQLVSMMEDAAGDMRAFCTQPFTNYRGTAPDSGRAYADIVAGWCLDNWPLFERISVITPERPYRDPLRDGTRPRRMSRAEQLLSRDLYVRFHPGAGARLNIIGRILDYQMPLSPRAADHAGTADLVAWDGEHLRLLKLKTQGSTDSMLRCLLESYTMMRTVNRARLLTDFSLPADAEVSASPFVYRGGSQAEVPGESAASLHRLMLASGCRPIWYIP